MQLFTAGPASTPPQLLQAFSLPPIHHRSIEFRNLYDTCKNSLIALCNLPYVFCLSSSGSGAMESAISSLNPSNILVLNHGKFSQRWDCIAQTLQIPTIQIKKEWNDNHHAQEVLETLKQYPHIDCVCLQSCESSGGVAQNYQEISQAIKSYNPDIVVVIDGIASIGIEPIEARYIDILIGASQKGLMLPAGLGFVWLSHLAKDKINSTQPKGYYLALQNYLKDEIAFSMPSCFFVALKKYFELLNPTENYKITAKRFELTKEILEQKNIPLYAKNPSIGIIAFEDQNAKIRSKLKEFDIYISEGQGKLKNQISRIGNFGILQEYDLLLNALKKI